MRDRFDDREWSMLTAMPYMLWVAVMGADSRLSDEEKVAFAEQFSGVAETKNELHRMLMASFTEDLPQSMENANAMVGEDATVALGTFKSILQSNLEHDEYQAFMGDLLFTLVWASQVDGGHVAEEIVVNGLIQMFDVAPAAIAAAGESYGASVNLG